jgi:hypothetical protein
MDDLMWIVIGCAACVAIFASGYLLGRRHGFDSGWSECFHGLIRKTRQRYEREELTRKSAAGDGAATKT